MKIFELLSGDVGTEPQPELQSAIAPIGAVQSPAAGPTGTTPGPAGTAQQPMQTAGLSDMMKDFMTTPQPIGGSAQPPTPTPPMPTPGQPPAQSSGMISRPFGGSAIGRNLDAINTGLQPPK